MSDQVVITLANLLLSGGIIGFLDWRTRSRRQRQQARIDEISSVMRVQDKLNKNMMGQLRHFQRENQRSQQREIQLIKDVAELRGIVRQYQQCTSDTCPFKPLTRG